uniref:Uncharacterized protein n=1 Tax=Sphaerodactylus townsendi TaxID=933632 RepID=A0ACB8EN98_9SAUR
MGKEEGGENTWLLGGWGGGHCSGHLDCNTRSIAVRRSPNAAPSATELMLGSRHPGSLQAQPCFQRTRSDRPHAKVGTALCGRPGGMGSLRPQHVTPGHAESKEAQNFFSIWHDPLASVTGQ